MNAVISGSQWIWPSHRGATVLEMVALEELSQDFNPGILIPEDHHQASLQLSRTVPLEQGQQRKL